MLVFSKFQKQAFNSLDEYMLEMPIRDVKYRGMKDGKIVIFDTKEEAVKAGVFNCAIETFEMPEYTTKKEAYWDQQRRIESEAFTLWYNALREEYGNLPTKVFALCYNEAYDRGHHAGHDEVANYMIDVTNFAEKVLKCKE